MVQELLKEEQTLTQLASKNGVHLNQLRRWKEAALTAMPAQFENEERFQKRAALLEAEHEREKEKLYAEIGRLTTQVNWLQKKIMLSVSRLNRRALIEPDCAQSELSLSSQAELLNLSRAINAGS